MTTFEASVSQQNRASEITGVIPNISEGEVSQSIIDGLPTTHLLQPLRQLLARQGMVGMYGNGIMETVGDVDTLHEEFQADQLDKLQRVNQLSTAVRQFFQEVSELGLYADLETLIRSVEKSNTEHGLVRQELQEIEPKLESAANGDMSAAQEASSLQAEDHAAMITASNPEEQQWAADQARYSHGPAYTSTAEKQLYFQRLTLRLTKLVISNRQHEAQANGYNQAADVEHGRFDELVGQMNKMIEEYLSVLDEYRSASFQSWYQKRQLEQGFYDAEIAPPPSPTPFPDWLQAVQHIGAQALPDSGPANEQSPELPAIDLTSWVVNRNAQDDE